MQSRLVAAALTVVASLSLGASSVRAVDQTILGKSYVVKDPMPGVDVTKRNLTVLGKEPLTPNTIVGDPIANGATVEIIANGTSPTTQTFNLPAGAQPPGGSGWKALGSPPIGYTYKDALGVNGPVKAALIKIAPKDTTFIVKVTAKGALGPGPQPHIVVLPPALGTDGGMRFTINGGDTYCVNFGGAAGGQITNAPPGVGTKTFKIVSKTTAPTSEAGCPNPPGSTTSTSSSTSTSVTSTTSSSTTTSTCPAVPGALTPTVGRFNYNLAIGLPAANAACNANFPGTHVCTYAELQAAGAACLAGLKDTASNPVNSFWAVDPLAPALTTQCQDDVVSFLNWEYGTAHTPSRGQKVTLNNGTGVLGALQGGIQCNSQANNLGCCP